MTNYIDSLNKEIFLLEQNKKNQVLGIKKQFGNTVESLKPINIVKKMVGKIFQTLKVECTTINKLLSSSIDTAAKTINQKVTNNPISIFLRVLYSFAKRK